VSDLNEAAAERPDDRHPAAFADASDKGSWALYSGPAEPLADRAALRPLGYNAADTIRVCDGTAAILETRVLKQ
jgi:hypothetical protein